MALFRTAWREAVNGCYEQEYRIRKGDGQVIWVLEKGRLVVDGEGEPVCICLLLDITERKMRQDELIRQTRLDPLTGLYNRGCAQQFIRTLFRYPPRRAFFRPAGVRSRSLNT